MSVYSIEEREKKLGKLCQAYLRDILRGEPRGEDTGICI